ncbi:hypothetical protein GCM10023318_61520 [Nocardia callitridis]|uniref:Uncharacterized protein n=1 Tax=Nocardia callitridis TaxID=648753 RepID=A0ABP9L677_9NOCA
MDAAGSGAAALSNGNADGRRGLFALEQYRKSLVVQSAPVPRNRIAMRCTRLGPILSRYRTATLTGRRRPWPISTPGAREISMVELTNPAARLMYIVPDRIV